MLGANWLIFALDPKYELDAETLVLHSGSKSLCFLVHSHMYLWFWYQTEIVSKKVYAVILPVLEITSLNFGKLDLICTGLDPIWSTLIQCTFAECNLQPLDLRFRTNCKGEKGFVELTGPAKNVVETFKTQSFCFVLF